MVTRGHVGGEDKGIGFRKTQAKMNPPFAGRDEEDFKEEALPERGKIEAEEVAAAGKLPLHPAVITAPASVLGRVGTELTGYPGFVFTERELNDLAELWTQCGVMMTPMLQAAIGTTGMVGMRFLGYFAWVKAGKPAIKGAELIGKETGKPEPEEEETE